MPDQRGAETLFKQGFVLFRYKQSSIFDKNWRFL
nr:MAG TPA: hypothetical protein [Caudoviricetes sp.]